MPLYEYVCLNCGAIHDKIFRYDDKPTEIQCEACEEGQAEYRVGAPAMFRVKFDQNGRVAYKYDMGNGVKQIRSATREAYEHNAGNRTSKDFKEMGSDRNKSVYTKAYDRHVRAKEKEKVARADATLKKIVKEAK